MDITRRGRQRLIDLDAVLTAAQDEAFAPLDADEREQLVAILSKMIDYHTHLTAG